jgi:hypothetical protein
MFLFKKLTLTSVLLISPVLTIPFIIQQVINSNNKSDLSETNQADTFALGLTCSVGGDELYSQK